MAITWVATMTRIYFRMKKKQAYLQITVLLFKYMVLINIDARRA